MNQTKKFLVAFFVIHCSSSSYARIHCKTGCSEDEHKCNGTTGDKLTIPCGEHLTNYNTTSYSYSYYYSNYTTLSRVLLINSSQLLSITLSPYDNQKRIFCTLTSNGTDTISSYYFDISVCYIYKLDAKNVGGINGNHNDNINIKCPINGNPELHCSWIFYWCTYTNSTAFIPLGKIEYNGVGKCGINIHKLTNVYEDVCFNCTATNTIGSETFVFNSIDFARCPDPNIKVFILADNQLLIDATVITVYAGQFVQLHCEVYGTDGITFVKWLIKTKHSATSNFSNNYTYSPDECHRKELLFLGNVSYSQSGNYTCLYGDGKLMATVELIVTDKAETGNKIQTNKRMAYTLTLILAVFVSILITAAVICTFIIYRRRSKSESDNELLLNDLDLCGKKEYDVFLSYAEDDIVAVERELKIPLEKLGYTICWHHKDFIPGYTILENIERAIYQSRYTICILSSSYMKSEFCQRELAIASKLSVDKSNICLIPIIIGKGCEIPIIFKITFIDFNDKSLIKKLTSTLGFPENNTINKD